ncbi:MAG: reverse transcriptase family protein, partial [Brevundimonas sp.]|uniref:reverse transcriptase family protein n=1 Tax=Brevundimonas sp. TaxID=1871086 RepID=UPI00391B9106
MPFSPQQFLRTGRSLGVSEQILQAAILRADRITRHRSDRAVVFTLGHLAVLSGVHYKTLRNWVGRWGPEPYRQFFLSKTPDRRRTAPAASRPMRRIAVPAPALMAEQRWLLERILHTAPQHAASVAFHRKSDIVDAARLHCGCRWLIKLDVRDFFESIYEPAVFRVFQDLGYAPLLAFELTRLCTRVKPDQDEAPGDAGMTRDLVGRGVPAYERIKLGPPAPWGRSRSLHPSDRAVEMRRYDMGGRLALPMGSLPQGAPTSPLLANLAVRTMDERISKIAADYGLVYTRYADDIALSTADKAFDREKAGEVIGKVFYELDRQGLRPHQAKTRIVPPGARKIVL